MVVIGNSGVKDITNVMSVTPPQRWTLVVNGSTLLLIDNNNDDDDNSNNDSNSSQFNLNTLTYEGEGKVTVGLDMLGENLVPETEGDEVTFPLGDLTALTTFMEKEEQDPIADLTALTASTQKEEEDPMADLTALIASMEKEEDLMVDLIAPTTSMEEEEEDEEEKDMIFPTTVLEMEEDCEEDPLLLLGGRGSPLWFQSEVTVNADMADLWNSLEASTAVVRTSTSPDSLHTPTVLTPLTPITTPSFVDVSLAFPSRPTITETVLSKSRSISSDSFQTESSTSDLNPPTTPPSFWDDVSSSASDLSTPGLHGLTSLGDVCTPAGISVMTSVTDVSTLGISGLTSVGDASTPAISGITSVSDISESVMHDMTSDHDVSTPGASSLTTLAGDVSTAGSGGMASVTQLLFPALPADDKMATATQVALDTGCLTPLIKEELKYTIQSRRLAAGKPELVVDARRRVRQFKVMTKEERDRYRNRREQNRKAAQRFRQKQKDTEAVLSKKCCKLEGSNNSLRTEIQRLARETRELQQLLNSHLPGCHRHVKVTR